MTERGMRINIGGKLARLSPTEQAVLRFFNDRTDDSVWTAEQVQRKLGLRKSPWRAMLRLEKLKLISPGGRI